MRWRWFIFDYVDPQLGLTRRERAKLRRFARTSRESLDIARRFPWRLGVMVIMAGACMAITMIPITTFGLSWRMFPMLLIVQMVITWIALALVGSWAYRPLVIEALQRLGYDVCSHCGYDLRGGRGRSDADRCPECGRSTQ